MKKLKTLCENCKHFERDKVYKYEGICKLDNEYTKEIYVCNKLDDMNERKKAKTK